MPNARPNAARERARALRATGLSERDVLAKLTSEGIRASKGSIGNWCRDLKPSAAPAPKKPGSKSAPPAPPSSPRSSSPASAPAGDIAGAWALEGVDLVQLPAELLERLGKKFAARIDDEVAKTVIDPQVLGGLMRDFERITKALVLARPPVQKDPEKDPASLEMAAIAIGHIKRMIADVRKQRAAPVEPPPPEAT